MALIVADALIEFVAETVISVVAGCMSLVSAIGLVYGVSYLVYKNAKFFCVIDTSESKKAKVVPEDSVDNIEESITREEKSQDLSAAPGSSPQDEIFEEQRQTWFLIGPSEEVNIKTLNDLLKHRKTIVASKTPHSNFNRDEKIRDFLEHLVASLIRGNLDDVPLTPLSNDVHYDTFFSTYHSKLSSKLAALSASLHSNQNSESLDEKVRPSTLYNELKSTIDEILTEAASLPPLQDFNDDTGIGPASLEICLEKLSYEEILSTAVLNEIISKKETGKSSSTEWNSRTNSKFTVNLTTEFKEDYEDYISPKSKEKFCFTVEERVEEITTKYQVPDDEIEPPLIQHTTNSNAIERHRAHFPELGKDVVDGEGSLETQPENDHHSENGHRNGHDQEIDSLAELCIANLNAQKQLNGFTCDPSPDQNLATPPKPGTIAEREHLKWQQATPIPNNPYSKESIEKRNLDNLLPKSHLNGSILNNSKFDDNEEAIVDNSNSEITVNSSSDLSGNFLKYERDYYINDKIDKTKTEPTNGTEIKAVHGDSNEKSPTQNGVAKGVLPVGVNSSPERRKCNLVRVSSWSERKNPDVEIRKKLPSVKELAKQFSNNSTDTNQEVRKYQTKNPAASFPLSKVNKVHSLTARSMSREFREGLKNNAGKTFNRNVLSNFEDDVDKIKNGCHNEKNEENIIRHNSQNGIIIWENQI